MIAESELERIWQTEICEQFVPTVELYRRQLQDPSILAYSPRLASYFSFDILVTGAMSTAEGEKMILPLTTQAIF